MVVWPPPCFISLFDSKLKSDIKIVTFSSCFINHPTVPTKSGAEHVEDSLFTMADEKDY